MRKEIDMEYIVEYYLPDQSHLFSSPMRYFANDKHDLSRVLSKAEQSNYDVIGVYEVQGDGIFVQIM